MQVGINVNPEEKGFQSGSSSSRSSRSGGICQPPGPSGNRQNFNRTGQSGQGVCRLPVLIDLISGNTLPRVLAQPRKKQELCKKQYLSPSCYWGFIQCMFSSFQSTGNPK